MIRPVPAKKGQGRAGRLSAWRVLLAGFLAAAIVTLTALAVGFMWRPDGAASDRPAHDFVTAIGNTCVPRAAIELLSSGKTTVTFTDAEIADVMAAAIDRNSSSVPAPVADALRGQVPPFVETISGCRIHGDDVIIYARCRKVVTFYVTITGKLSKTRQGSLMFRTTGARVGLFRVPQGMLKRAGAAGEQVLIDPGQTDFAVAGMVPGQGRITLNLVAARGED